MMGLVCKETVMFIKDFVNWGEKCIGQRSGKIEKLSTCCPQLLAFFNPYQVPFPAKHRDVQNTTQLDTFDAKCISFSLLYLNISSRFIFKRAGNSQQVNLFTGCRRVLVV